MRGDGGRDEDAPAEASGTADHLAVGRDEVRIAGM